MTAIVGIFDNARDLDKAVERLAAAGFDDTVYDESILAQEPGDVAPVPVGPVPVGAVLAPGVIPPGSLSSVAPDLPTIVRAFRARLADYHLSEEVIQAYATTFYHKGKFILVRTDTERAEQAMEILRECGATRVNRHD